LRRAVPVVAEVQTALVALVVAAIMGDGEMDLRCDAMELRCIAGTRSLRSWRALPMVWV
jgi:hypothetical protein